MWGQESLWELLISASFTQLLQAALTPSFFQPLPFLLLAFSDGLGGVWPGLGLPGGPAVMESLGSPQCNEVPDWKVGVNREPFLTSQRLTPPLPEKSGGGRVGGWH